jgi:pimeloyl-ACP methyl ester carboxylesterase
MSTFVLVPGAWLGAWVWATVATSLRERGHKVHPISLPGLAERFPSKDVGLADHVADLRAQLSRDDLRDVILLGHSYSGIVTGQVAVLEPERVARAVFLDANVPIDGKSLADSWTPPIENGWWPVPGLEEFDGHDLTAAQVEWLISHATPHPARTVLEPAELARPLASLTATYIHCLRPEMWRSPEVEALRGAPGWSFATLDTGHWPMVSRPKELTDLLNEIA